MAPAPGESRLVYVVREDARHVGVNAEQLRRRLQAHLIHDHCAPITTLRDEFRVAQALHQHDPGARNVLRVPAGRGRFPGKPVAWHRRNDDIECLLCCSTMRRRIRQRINDLQLFDNRARPTVRDVIGSALGLFERT